MQGRERDINTLSVRRPQPTLPTYRGKEEKEKIVEDKKGESNKANKKALDLLLKPPNPTPSNTGSTRPFQRDTERGINVLRVSAEGRLISTPMCDKSTGCNSDWDIRHR